MSFLTDGTWGWPSFFSYYIRVHRVFIDPYFIAHMKKMNFACPQMNGDEIRLLTARVFGD
jgi:hypothetical protein